MKPRLPHLLAAACVALAPLSPAPAGAASPPTDAGNVMYIGDSITHGVGSGSYRWALFKIFTDNGITHNEIGITSGNHSSGIAPGAAYGGQAFANIHASQASERAYEIAGRQNTSGRLGNTGIEQWLGLDPAYNGPYRTANGAAPDTCFIMIGTNDLLSDSGDFAAKTANLLGTYDNGAKTAAGDMDAIVGHITAKNADADIYVATIPCWTQHANSNDAATHLAVQQYNGNLQTWAAEHDNVTLIDINKGIVDIASATPFYGVASMFKAPGSDGLHPGAQGDLIIAGNIAKALGYAGRSAGQERKTAAQLQTNLYGGAAAPAITAAALQEQGFTLANASVSGGDIDLSAAGESTLAYTWGSADTPSGGFTVDILMQLGNGATGGWDTSNLFTVALGNGTHYGQLNISEAYIQWGGTVLYSADMSSNADYIRIAYLTGNNAEGLQGGYYVWLGDTLIGEALAATAGGKHNGLRISYSGSLPAAIQDIALDNTGSYAPPATGTYNPGNTYISQPTPGIASPPQGNITWKTDAHTAENNNLTASGTLNARNSIDSSAGAAGNSIAATITGGNAAFIYANNGNYTGDVWLTISNEGSASSWYAAHTGSGATLNGDARIRFTGTASGGSTVFGAVNTGTLNGSVYLEFSAAGASFGTFTGNAEAPSVLGSYAASISGNVDIVINSGAFSHQIIGGIYTGANTIGGSTALYVNGGDIKSNLIGGGLTGTIDGNTGVTVTGGTVAGNIYGGNKGNAAIKGNSSVTITGGTVKGNIYAGGANGTIRGGTTLTLDGGTAQYSGTTAISAGGTGGSILGSSTLIIKNLSPGSTPYSLDQYTGAISGGANIAGTRTLILDNVTAGLAATLQDFDIIQTLNGTNTTLTSLGGAHTLNIGAGTSLTVNGSISLDTLILANNTSLTISAFTRAVIIDITNAANYTLTVDTHLLDLDLITFKHGDTTYLPTLQTDPQAGQTLIFAAIPEPATPALTLLGLASLLIRRKRT